MPRQADRASPAVVNMRLQRANEHDYSFSELGKLSFTTALRTDLPAGEPFIEYPKPMKTIRHFVAAAAVGLLAASAGAQTAPMPDLTLLRVGDRWEWRQFDNRTRLPEPGVSRVVIEEQGVRQFTVEGMRRALAYPYVGEPSARPWRVWPLEVGKRWPVDMNFERADGSTGNLKMDARVVAHEEVEVPAGKFMAFKIEYDGFVSVGSFHGRMADTFWYAPEARADVKQVRKLGNANFTRELVAYPRLAEQPVAAHGAVAPAVPVASSVPPAAPQAGASPAAAQPAADSRSNRLRELEQLRKEGLITPQEYEEKRKAILATL